MQRINLRPVFKLRFWTYRENSWQNYTFPPYKISCEIQRKITSNSDYFIEERDFNFTEGPYVMLTMLHKNKNTYRGNSTSSSSIIISKEALRISLTSVIIREGFKEIFYKITFEHWKTYIIFYSRNEHMYIIQKFKYQFSRFYWTSLRHIYKVFTENLSRDAYPLIKT